MTGLWWLIHPFPPITAPLQELLSFWWLPLTLWRWGHTLSLVTRPVPVQSMAAAVRAGTRPRHENWICCTPGIYRSRQRQWRERSWICHNGLVLVQMSDVTYLLIWGGVHHDVLLLAVGCYYSGWQLIRWNRGKRTLQNRPQHKTIICHLAYAFSQSDLLMPAYILHMYAWL